jgi:hypothetical protein
MNEINQINPNRNIDPILAELWEVKKQINQESGYQIQTLVEMAHAAAITAGKTANTVGWISEAHPLLNCSPCNRLERCGMTFLM